MLDLLLRFRRPRSQQTGGETAKEEPPVGPPAITSYVAQKIHPDLDSLAAELELERTVLSEGASSPALNDTLPLSPGTRPRRQSQSLIQVSKPVNAGESTISLSTASSNETRAHRVLKRLASFGQQSPPSAWSTFGRKTIRETHSVPHITDFGGSTPSQSHSRNSTSTPSSTWHSHSSPAGDNAMNNTFGSASSPSSGFTFGSRSNGATFQPTIPPLPPLPPLDNPKHPRPSASLPSMSDNRPMAQDIFNPSQPKARRERDARKQHRRRSGSIGGFRKTTPSSLNSSNPVLGSPFAWSGMSSSAKGKEPQRSPPLAESGTIAASEQSPVQPVAPTASTEKARGKRKAEEVEGGGTPPDLRKEKRQHRATFAVEDPRPHRASGNSGTSSHAPSSYQRKRARLSGHTYSSNPVGEGNVSRPGSRSEGHSQAVNASNTGSGASRISRNNVSIVGHHPFRSQSRSSHTQGRPPSRSGSTRRPPSLSQASIPISALISPHAPSVSHRSDVFHMRDPRRPAPIQSTPWSLSFPTPADGQAGYLERWKWKNILSRLRGRSEEHKVVDRVGWTEGGGSPIHSWLFFLGFILFPVWWVAGFLIKIPKTRRIGDGGIEKGVVLDDPQVEFDARSWRTRCRVMSVISIFTYIPFIVLVAVFVPR